MKPWIGFSLVLTMVTGCNTTRPPVGLDAIDAGAVQRVGWRPSAPPNKFESWEDSIDAGAVRTAGWRPSGPPSGPVAFEDSIDAGRVNPAWRRSGSRADEVVCPAAEEGKQEAEPAAGRS